MNALVFFTARAACFCRLQCDDHRRHLSALGPEQHTRINKLKSKQVSNKFFFAFRILDSAEAAAASS